MEKRPGRRVTEGEARWIARVEVGNDLELLRQEASVKLTPKPIPLSLSEIVQLSNGFALERVRLIRERKELKGVPGASTQRHELSERIQRLKLDINALKREKKKLAKGKDV